MKNTKLPILFTMIALLLFLTWDSVPSVSSQGKHRSSTNAQKAKASRPESAPSKPERDLQKTIDAVRNGEAPESSLFTSDDPDSEAQDPDLPPWMAGKIDKGTYLRLRNDYIDMRRGRPYNLSYDPREKAIQEMDKQEAAQRQRAQRLELPSLATWTALGPTPIPNGQTSDTSVPVSGRTIAIAIHPTDPNTLYVGTAQGGLYKSTDGGNTWTALFEFQLESLAINAITIDPTDSNIVYVGTGEAAFSADSSQGKGMYIIRSANSASPTLNGPFRLDAGAVDVFSGRAIGRILVNPLDNNTIFLCTTSATGGNPNAGPFTVPLRGIYRSTNAQSASPTFAQVLITGTASNDRNVVDMVMDPGDPNLLIATVVGGASDGGIYRTANALAATPTFTRTRTLPDGATNGRAELDINRNGSVVTVYAAVGQTSSIALGGPANCAATRSGYVTRSVDGGLTWSTPLAGSTGFCGGQCFYDIAIAATQDNLTIHLGGAARGGAATCLIDVMKRSTGGGSFVRNDSTLHADEHALAIAPSNQNVVYTGSDGGIWRSSDNGTTWVSKNTFGFSATQFQSLSVHPLDRYFTIGGTQDNGTNCLSPDGTTWNHCRDGDGGYTLIDTNAVDTTNVTMYHTFFNQPNNQIAFERASDTSFAWTFRGCSGVTSNNGMTCGDAVLFYAPMEQGPGNPNTIYFGTDRLYRSTNQGDLMTLVSQAPLVSGQVLTTIGISPQNDNVRIVGLRNGQVWATTTGSSTLTNVTGAGFPPANPNDPTRKAIGRAVIDPNNVNTAYITFSSFGLPSGQQVFKTTDLNSATPTWVAAGNGIPDVPVSAFIVDPQDSNVLYAGTDIGVYQSLDGGTSWLPFGTGLPRVAVFDMDISNNHRILRIATHGRGLYEISIPGVLLPVPRPGGNGNSGPGGASVITYETCPNGVMDPAETVGVTFDIKNIGGGPTTNLVATLQATGGVVSPSTPQNYGAIPAGSTVSKGFVFQTSGSCGATITLTFQVQDGATNYGNFVVTYVMGTPTNGAPTFTENFDGVVAPALPAGWTTALVGTAPLWVTDTISSDTATNSAFGGGTTTPGDNSLTSPTIPIPAAPGAGTNPGVDLTFRNSYNTEAGFDGGVLEISSPLINAGAFTDIVTAGGSFVTGGYVGTLAAGSALATRQAWTGTSNGFITTTVRLPALSYGQNAQLRWRTAYDNGTSPGGGGMRVDTISIYTTTLICCGPTAATASLSGRIVTASGAPLGGVTMRLAGGGQLSAITDGNGNYRFSGLETNNFYTITPSLVNYQFSPASRSFSLVGNKTDAMFTAAPDAVIVSNAIDTSEYFVRQQYLDFLGREPEAGGFNYWSDQVNACNGEADCIRTRRIDVSAAFFMSQEFRDTGSFVYRLYKGALGRQLRYSEFSADRAQVVGGPNLEASKTAFADAFVQRAEFADKYQGSTTAEAFVDALLQTMNDSAGVNLSSERTALINRYHEGASLNASRALVVRQLVDNATFAGAVYNQSFVTMEYFGYLRRTPDTAGYQFWLNVLDHGDPGNYRGMVCSFITSAEYQRRFSTVVSHSNAECGQ